MFVTDFSQNMIDSYASGYHRNFVSLYFLQSRITSSWAHKLLNVKYKKAVVQKLLFSFRFNIYVKFSIKTGNIKYCYNCDCVKL
jgi:hypothetical protein